MPLPLHFTAQNNHRPGSITLQPHRSVDLELTCTLPHAELTRLYRTIETALPNQANRVVQFVSAYEGEGASTIALETAIIAARLIGKRVLFIDTAVARLGTKRKLPDNIGDALDTLMVTGRMPNEAITQVNGTNLHFAMLRERGEDGFTPASLAAIEGALEALRHNFDLIIVDSQALLTDAFGMAVAKLVDGSVLVVEAERTRMAVSEQSKRMIEAGGGRVIGAILNKRRFHIPTMLYNFLYQ